MLANVLRMLGIDLQQQANLLVARGEAFRDQGIDRVAKQLKHTCLIVGLALTGGLLFLTAAGIGLAALYQWVAIHHGPMAAFGATGGVAAVLGAVMFSFAAAAANRQAVPPAVVVKPYPVATPPQTVSGTAPITAAVIAPPPPGAPLIDVISHRVTARAAAASDEAINSAVEFVRTGPRSALFGTLAVTVLAGLLIGRRKP